jgi:hypothetical protein
MESSIIKAYEYTMHGMKGTINTSVKSYGQ